jgi:hypothetical protein
MIIQPLVCEHAPEKDKMERRVGLVVGTVVMVELERNEDDVRWNEPVSKVRRRDALIGFRIDRTDSVYF